MSEHDTRPLCPQCGCPARYVLAPALIRFELDRACGEHRVMSVRDVRRGPDDKYECGLGHTWLVQAPPPELDRAAVEAADAIWSAAADQTLDRGHVRQVVESAVHAEMGKHDNESIQEADWAEMRMAIANRVADELCKESDRG